MTITVATNNARIRYTATSGQTAFAIPFEFLKMMRYMFTLQQQL